MIADTLCQLRARAQHLAATVASEAQRARAAVGDASVTDRAIAKRWAVQHSYVAKLFDADSGKAITLRDVLALPRELAREILTRALAALDDDGGTTASDTQLRLAVQLGRLSETLQQDLADDGKLNDYRAHEALFSRIAAIALRGVVAAQKEQQ